MTRTGSSVAEALGRAHAAVLGDLQDLDRAAGAHTTLAALRSRLSAIRTHLTEHFRFEEQNGYLEVVRKREPRLERAIEQLAEEHRQLIKGLNALLVEAVQATTLDAPLCEKVRVWTQQVRRHEVRENDLVQDAFCSEIGAED
jgi:hypothetical protein